MRSAQTGNKLGLKTRLDYSHVVCKDKQSDEKA